MLKGSSLLENKFMKRHTQTSAFTLIELLMVIAIIGILAGILIPTVGAVRKQANIAASKAQLSNYVTAINMFKGEYGYFPFPAAQKDSGELVNSLPAATEDFVETLSGRDSDGDAVTTGGNRRSIAFHSFSESEFELQDDDTIDEDTIADRFNNSNIYIVIDDDGDNEVTVPNTSGSGTKTVKTSVTAYTLEDSALGAPPYYLYD
jgi:prepilin-type N-terminal cleavage/methylation domain-containing protein